MKTNPAVKVSEHKAMVWKRDSRGKLITVFANTLVEHPFKEGDKVRIGDGKTVWTVNMTSAQHVSLVRPRPGTFGNFYRCMERADVARLFHVDN